MGGGGGRHPSKKMTKTEAFIEYHGCMLELVFGTIFLDRWTGIFFVCFKNVHFLMDKKVEDMMVFISVAISLSYERSYLTPPKIKLTLKGFKLIWIDFWPKPSHF